MMRGYSSLLAGCLIPVSCQREPLHRSRCQQGHIQTFAMGNCLSLRRIRFWRWDRCVRTVMNGSAAAALGVRSSSTTTDNGNFSKWVHDASLCLRASNESEGPLDSPSS